MQSRQDLDDGFENWNLHFVDRKAEWKDYNRGRLTQMTELSQQKAETKSRSAGPKFDATCRPRNQKDDESLFQRKAYRPKYK